MIETDLSAAALATMGAVFGLLIGSFLNVVILRVPLQLNAEWRRDARDFLGLKAEASASSWIFQEGVIDATSLGRSSHHR